MRDANGRQDARDADRRGALNVVVKTRDPPPVAVENGERDVLVEIFPLHQGIREHTAYAIDETFDEVIVGLTAQTTLSIAQVEWVL